MRLTRLYQPNQLLRWSEFRDKIDVSKITFATHLHIRLTLRDHDDMGLYKATILALRLLTRSDF